MLFDCHGFIWTRQTICKSNKNTIGSSFTKQDIENTLPVESATSSLGQTCFFQKQSECESWLQLCHLI